MPSILGGIPGHYLDSFSDRNSADFLKKHWAAVGGPGLAKIEAGGRLGSQCYNFDDNVPIIGPFQTVVPPLSPSKIGFGAAVKRSVILVTDVDFGNGWIFMTRGTSIGGDIQVGFVFTQDARIAVTAGGGSNLLAISDPAYAMHLDTWYFIEADLTFHAPLPEPAPDTGWNVDANIFIEGVQVLSAATLPIGENRSKNAYPAYFLFGQVYGGHKFNRYCDLYVRYGTLSYSTEGLFAGKVIPLRPSGDSVIEWPSITPASPTTHYDKENDTLIDTANYIEVSNILSPALEDRTSSVIDEYPVSAIDITLTPATRPVRAAQFGFYGTGTSDEDSGRFRTFHEINNDEDKYDFLASSAKYAIAFFEDHPNSPGNPYRVSDVNGTIAGVKCRFTTDAEYL